MKYVQKPFQMRNLLIAVTSLFILFSAFSCAKKITFLTSAVVPAAEGTVKVTMDDNKNYRIKIELSNLAAPDRLQPAKKMYLVWMETSENATKNLGQIISETGFLSGKRTASFETVSSVKPLKIIITAEDDATVQYPGNLVVLSTENF